MKEMGVIGFDLEIAEPFPNEGWDRKAPLGVSCAATYSENPKYQRIFYPALDGDRYKDRMSEEEVKDMLRVLLSFEGEDNHIVTWNGLGFDFLVLYLETEDPMFRKLIRKMAMRHIDPYFAMFCDKGYGIGLQKAAESLGLSGKLEGMHGSLAPLMWNAEFEILSPEDASEISAMGLTRGSKEAQDLCIKYVVQDARTTYDVYNGIFIKGAFYWITRSGSMSRYPWVPRKKYNRLLTCEEANQTPEPNTSWMDSPRPRSDVIGWIFA